MTDQQADQPSHGTITATSHYGTVTNDSASLNAPPITTYYKQGPLDATFAPGKLDTYIVQLVFLVCGMAMMLPTYSTYLLRPHFVEIFGQDKAVNFLYRMSIVTSCIGPVVQLVALYLRSYINFTTTIFLGFTINAATLFAFVAYLRRLHQSESSHMYWVVAAFFIIIHIQSSLLRNTFFSLSALFPSVFTHILLIGQTVALSALMTCNLLFNWQKSTTITFPLFIAVGGFSLGSLILYQISRRFIFSPLFFPAFRTRRMLQEGRHMSVLQSFHNLGLFPADGNNAQSDLNQGDGTGMLDGPFSSDLTSSGGILGEALPSPQSNLMNDPTTLNALGGYQDGANDEVASVQHSFTGTHQFPQLLAQPALSFLMSENHDQDTLRIPFPQTSNPERYLQDCPSSSHVIPIADTHSTLLSPKNFQRKLPSSTMASPRHLTIAEGDTGSTSPRKSTKNLPIRFNNNNNSATNPIPSRRLIGQSYNVTSSSLVDPNSSENTQPASLAFQTHRFSSRKQQSSRSRPGSSLQQHSTLPAMYHHDGDDDERVEPLLLSDEDNDDNQNSSDADSYESAEAHLRDRQLRHPPMVASSSSVHFHGETQQYSLGESTLPSSSTTVGLYPTLDAHDVVGTSQQPEVMLYGHDNDDASSLSESDFEDDASETGAGREKSLLLRNGVHPNLPYFHHANIESRIIRPLKHIPIYPVLRKLLFPGLLLGLTFFVSNGIFPFLLSKTKSTIPGLSAERFELILFCIYAYAELFVRVLPYRLTSQFVGGVQNTDLFVYSRVLCFIFFIYALWIQSVASEPMILVVGFLGASGSFCVISIMRNYQHLVLESEKAVAGSVMSTVYVWGSLFGRLLTLLCQSIAPAGNAL